MKAPGLDLPPSTKRVWRLKKYTRTSTEIQEEQEKYADLEFSPKKSSRRPKNKPGEQQEFVFVDLSPRKKESPKVPATLTTLRKNELPMMKHVPETPTLSTSPTTATDSSSLESNYSKRHPLTRLFRLSSQAEVKPQLLESPDLASHATSKPQLAQVQTQQLEYERPARPLIASRSSSPMAQPIPQLRRTLTPQLVMTVSSTGRAVLQPSSASSSTTDLFSLHSHQRSPSPKREADSPLEYLESSEDDSNDACRAFERAVRRKRANTAGSTHSITRLSRTQSISSMSSAHRARMSPSRAAMLRQSTPIEARPPPMDEFGSFFDDASREQRRPMGHLRSQKSISTLGPALGMDDLSEFDGELTMTMDRVKSEPQDELAEFFDFSAFGEEHFTLQDI